MACVVSCLLSLRTAPEAVYSDDVSTLAIPAGCPFRCTAVLACSMASSAASRSSCATNYFQSLPAVHEQSCARSHDGPKRVHESLLARPCLAPLGPSDVF